MVPHRSKGEEDLFSASDPPTLADGFRVFTDIGMALRSKRDLDALEEVGDRGWARKPFVGDSDPEGAEGQRGVELLPPFGTEVVVACRKMEVGRVNGLEQQGGYDMQPNPQRGLGGDMAAGKDDDRFPAKDFPAEAKLVECGLEGFGHLPRKNIARAGCRPLHQTRVDRIIRCARADKVWTAKDKDGQSEFVESAGLAVDLVRHDAMGTRAVDYEVEAVLRRHALTGRLRLLRISVRGSQESRATNNSPAFSGGQVFFCH